MSHPPASPCLLERNDGYPAAAARMAAMSAHEVRDRLADRFRLLKGPEPGPDRQQTLRNAVGWSYDLLSDAERDLLRITSVFAGGFDLASLCAVVEGPDEVEVLGHLDSLVRKSLVVADHTTPRTRYRLFETIRQFAEDRLSEAGGLERMRDRHAAHFGHEAAARWERWNGPGWRDAVDWVDVELGNLRSGFRWSAGRGDIETADGRTAREVAAQLFISSRTAEHHIQHVYTKIGVSGRAAATRWAVKHNVVDAAGR